MTAGFLLLCRLFSSCRDQGPLSCGAWASHCGGFSRCRAWALGGWISVAVAHGLGSCDSWALEHRLSGCDAQAWLQADSLPLSHQGSPSEALLYFMFNICFPFLVT